MSNGPLGSKLSCVFACQSPLGSCQPVPTDRSCHPRCCHRSLSYYFPVGGGGVGGGMRLLRYFFVCVWMERGDGRLPRSPPTGHTRGSELLRGVPVPQRSRPPPFPHTPPLATDAPRPPVSFPSVPLHGAGLGGFIQEPHRHQAMGSPEPPSVIPTMTKQGPPSLCRPTPLYSSRGVTRIQGWPKMTDTSFPGSTVSSLACHFVHIFILHSWVVAPPTLCQLI